MYRVHTDEGQAILKLNHTERETNILESLGAVSNVVQLLGKANIIRFKQQDWHAILVRPFGRSLAITDTARLHKQAAFDIAAAVKGSFAKNIRHQDISPFNMVVYQDRVFLTDWSAGRVLPGQGSSVEDLGPLTMTPLFAAISVLRGSQHSVSSHLESLFYSLYYLALNSKLPGDKVFTTYANLRTYK